MEADDYANAVDAFQDSDLMYDGRAEIRNITKRTASFEALLLDAFKAGWDARGADSEGAKHG